MVDEMLHGGLLEPIDLRKDVRQRGGVRRAEVPAARRVGDLAEQLLVDLHRHRLIAQAQRALPRRDRCRSEEHTSELQSPCNLVCRLLLEKKKNTHDSNSATC